LRSKPGAACAPFGCGKAVVCRHIPRSSGSSSRASRGPKMGQLFAVALDPGDHALLGPLGVEAPEFLDAGGARHVHLDQLLADQVEPHEPQPALAQLARDARHECLLTGAELGGHDSPARMNVGAHVVLARYALNRAERLAVEQEHALVSGAYLG